MRSRSLAVFGWVAAAVLLGTLVRMLPWFVDPGLDLRTDASYHERIIATTVETGSPPLRDPLSESPDGRRLRTYLPEGLYHLAAWFHRVFARVGSHDLRFNVLLFISLSGALIAVPVWFATRWLSGSLLAAAAAAFIVSFLPGHVHRSVCYWVRYDALGTTLAMMHVALAIRALRASTSRRRLATVLSAACLVAALWIWRVPLIFPLMAGAFVAFRTARRGAEPAVREWFTILVVITALGVLPLEYLRTQGFLWSAPWLAICGVVAAIWLPTTRPGSNPVARIATLAVLALAGAGIGMTLAPPSPYGAVSEVLLIKLREVFGDRSLADAQTGIRALLLQVEELYAFTPTALLIGPQQFFVLGPWFFAAPWLFARAGRWRLRRLRLDRPEVELVAMIALALSAATLGFVRNKILLGPVLAIVCGALMVALWTWGTRTSGAAPPDRAAAARGSRWRPSRDARGGRPPVAGWIFLIGFAASAVVTMVTGVILAYSRESRLYPQLVASMDWIREHTPGDAIVLSAADLGYDLQRYTGRGTLTDGLLESPVNQRRIVEIYRAFLDPDPDSLRATCERYQVTHLLIPSGEWLLTFAEVAGEPFAARLREGRRLEPRHMDRTVIRLMLGENPPAPFRQVFERQGFRTYAVVPADASPAGGR